MAAPPPKRASRQAEGLCPVRRRNSREKYSGSSNPADAATAPTGSAVEASSCRARWSRQLVRYSLGEHPYTA